LTSFNVDIWIKKNFAEAEKQRAAQNGGLKIAGSGDKREEQAFEVQMEDDKDEATRRREREAEAEAKRQQNVLPAWHLKSTISNDLTSLGVKAKAHESGSGSNAALLESLSKQSESLVGLGKPGHAVKKEQTEVTIVEDVKPVVNQDADCEWQLWLARAWFSNNSNSLRTVLCIARGGLSCTFHVTNTDVGFCWQRFR
jgi:transcription initiation factor TFIIE subunit alpha